jgi:hypothetical protein
LVKASLLRIADVRSDDTVEGPFRALALLELVAVRLGLDRQLTPDNANRA